MPQEDYYNASITLPPMELPTLMDSDFESESQISSVLGGKTFDAIVAEAGGTHLSIQDAIADGKKNIFVRNGTYILDKNIKLDSDISIIGENIYNTIIDCNGLYQMVAVGDTPESKGTISLTNGSTTVVGSGTAWSGTLVADDFLVPEGGSVYLINAVSSDTVIVIDKPFEGDTQSGVSYHAGTFKKNIQAENFTLTGQDEIVTNTYVLSIQGVVNSNLNNILVQDGERNFSFAYGITFTYGNNFSNLYGKKCEYGLYMQESEGNKLTNIVLENMNSAAVWFAATRYNDITNISGNYSDYGFYFDTGAAFNDFTNLKAIGNRIYGIYLGAGNLVFSKGLLLKNDIPLLSESAGIKNLFSGITIKENINPAAITRGKHNKFIGCDFSENSGNGININGGQYNIIANCNFHQNEGNADILLQTNAAVHATNNIIANNIFLADGGTKVVYHVKENDANQNYNLIHGNIFEGATSTEVALVGANSIARDNIGDDEDVVVDYSSSVTATGWSSTTAKVLHYKKKGTSVHLFFRISGTSDSTSASINLPFTAINDATDNIHFINNIRAMDNGAWLAAGAQARIVENSATLTFETSSDGSGWTASGTKDVLGEIWYEIASENP